MKNSALFVAGVVFLIVAIVHLIRYTKGYVIVFNHFAVPMDWSIYGGVFTAILAVWMFLAALK